MYDRLGMDPIEQTLKNALAILVGVVVVTIYYVNVYKARKRNRTGMCARCGKPLGKHSDVILMGNVAEPARLCAACSVKTERDPWILFALLVASIGVAVLWGHFQRGK